MSGRELEDAGRAAAPPAAARRPGALMLSVGTVASGVLAYAFNAVAARALGPDAYGPVAVLWAAMFLVAVVLFRPVEQTLSQGVAARLAAGQDAGGVVRGVAWLALTAAGVAMLACVAAWGPITAGLFAGQDVLTAMLVAGIAGYGLSYVLRGLVGGQRWYAGYGVLLLADGGVRLLVALPLLLVASTAVAGIAVAAAAFGGALAVLLAPGWRRRPSLRGAPGPAFRPLGALRFAAPATAIALADQVLLSGGPVLVMLAGGHGASAAAGVVFAATMLVRAPAYLFQGVAAALLPNLTTLRVQRDDVAFRRAVARTVAILVAFAGLMVAGALAVGPSVMARLYGEGFDVGRLDLALLAAGAGGYLVAATLSQAALASRQAVAAAAVWAAAAVAFVGLEVALPGDPLHRVALAFCVAALGGAVAFCALALAEHGSRARGTARARSTALAPEASA